LTTLVFGASNFFLHLQDALNIIWQAPPAKPGLLRRVLKRRVLSFALVMLVPVLLLTGPLISAVLSWLGKTQGSTIVVSLIVETVIFALVFKVLPDIPVPWQDVWVGALFTAALFTVGQTILGFYLNHVAARSVYGAAGSLVALLIWVHASAQMLLLGAEFIQVYKPASPANAS
jgi:membrane protein